VFNTISHALLKKLDPSHRIARLLGGVVPPEFYVFLAQAWRFDPLNIGRNTEEGLERCTRGVNAKRLADSAMEKIKR
jgi:hypothetical protein